MYLDSARQVTIGYGVNLTAVGGAAAAVNMLHGETILKSTKNPAPPPDIEADYQAVSASTLQNRKGTRAEAEKFDRITKTMIHWKTGEKLALLRLGQEKGYSNLRSYPDFEHAPIEAQITAFDIIYNVGGAGFSEFKRFRKSYLRRDWKQASIEQASPSRSRNKERMNIVNALLLKLEESSDGFFIKFDAEKGKGIDIRNLG